jgi:hypothetical protein
VLELITWFTNCIATVQSADAGYGVSTASEDVGINASEAVFSKKQSYALLAALQELHHSFGAHELHAGAAAGGGGGGGGGGLKALDSIEYGRRLQTLQLSLLSLLCNGTISENASRARDHANATHALPTGTSWSTTFGGTSSIQQMQANASSRSRASRFGHTLSGTSLQSTKMGSMYPDTNLEQSLAFEALTGSNIGVWL